MPSSCADSGVLSGDVQDEEARFLVTHYAYLVVRYINHHPELRNQHGVLYGDPSELLDDLLTDQPPVTNVTPLLFAKPDSARRRLRRRALSEVRSGS